MLEKLTAGDFQPFVDSFFEGVAPGNRSCRLQLTGVEDHPSAGENADQEKMRAAFSLIFSVPEGMIDRQGIVVLSHPDLKEPMAVFMVAGGTMEKLPGQMECRVSFN